jgi:hypothetical protein
MDDLRIEVLEILASLGDEQVREVLAYARGLTDGPLVTADHQLERLLEEPA